MKRKKVVWKIVVGALLILGQVGGINRPPDPTMSGTEFRSYQAGRILFWIVGAYLLVTGLRGRLPNEEFQ